MLEKFIQQLDFSEYTRKDELQLICETHFLVNALMYLMTNHDKEELGCMRVLVAMFKLYEKAADSSCKEDVLRITQVDAQKKYDIEKSKTYIGYKLLWAIRMFLHGKMFPFGTMSEERYRQHVYDISHFVITKDYLTVLLDFDSHAVILSHYLVAFRWQAQAVYPNLEGVR